MVNQTKFNNFKKHLKMKKLFFSAVALIAFSSVSMANTMDLEDFKIEEKVEILGVDCNQWAIDKINHYENMNGCLTPTQYGFYFNSYFNECMDKKLKDCDC